MTLLTSSFRKKWSRGHQRSLEVKNVGFIFEMHKIHAVRRMRISKAWNLKGRISHSRGVRMRFLSAD